MFELLFRALVVRCQGKGLRKGAHLSLKALWLVFQPLL